MACGSPQPPSETAPDGERAARALVEAIEFVRAVHPAPHRFTSAAELDRIVESEGARLRGEPAPDQLSFGRALHRVFAAIGDFHLLVGLPLYSQKEPLELLPLIPIQIGDRVYVDASIPELPPGTELVSFEGVAIAELYRELEGLVAADGRNPIAIRRQLELDFPKFVHLQRGFRPSWALEVRRPGGDTEAFTLAAVPRESMATPAVVDPLGAAAGSVARGVKPWPAVARRGEMAVLRLASFGMPELDEYRRRVDAAFAELANTRGLIIDVRGNPGGLRPNAIAVLAHLMPGPYRQWDATAVATTRVPERFRGRVTFPFGSDKQRLAPYRDGKRRAGDPLGDHMRRSESRYDRPVVVVADALTNSAANTFVLALARFAPAVQVVGTEIGGGCARHVGELPVVYQTGFRGVVVMTSMIDVEHVAVASCRPGRGFVPSHRVDYSIDDWLAGRDPFLDRALELLRAGARPARSPAP